MRNGVWPTSTNNLVVVCGFSLYLLEYNPKPAEPLTEFLREASYSLPLPQGKLFSDPTEVLN